MTKAQQDFLLWFFENADFGPADCDVRHFLFKAYEQETGRKVPKKFLES